MNEQIVVRVLPDGTVHAETVGMVGPACLDHVERLEQLLDATTVSSRTTADYDRGVQTETTQHNQSANQSASQSVRAENHDQ